MTRDGLHRLTGLRRYMLVAAAALTVALVAAVPALATEPTGDFAVFKQCPLSNPSVNLCIFSQTTSGEFRIGSTTVPISTTITLQGGIIENEETGAETFVAPSGGETLSSTPLTVPGGLLGVVAPEILPAWLRHILNEIIDHGPTGVTATTELLGTPSINRFNLLDQSGVALELPVRVHLSNAFLGSGCYIGSSAEPVIQRLTTGTTSPPGPNLPITGAVGEFEFKDNYELAVISNNSLVNNAWRAPKAEGCGGLLSALIDPAVNLKLGLPSEPGNNTTILDGTVENTSAASVRNSEH